MNAWESRTVFRSALQGGHQFDPLKSISTIFLSSFAFVWAFDKSVSQSPSPAHTCHRVQQAIKQSIGFFMFYPPL
jgi:hypothetical protein